MSIIPLTETIKSTVEVLNEIYEIQSAGIEGFGSLLMTFLKFSGMVLKDWIVYALTFQWLNDFIQLPIILPQGSESIFSDLFHHLLNTSHPYHLNFLPSPAGHDFALPVRGFLKTSFFSGFLNCFFLYFPLSPVQFIWLRYAIIEGLWAGRAATIGIIFGHISLFGFCLFGFRPIIHAWFGLEPFSYFLGIWLIFTVIFEMTHRPFKLIAATAKGSKKKEFFKILFINFGLVWTDQSGFYQFFGNLALHSGTSPLDSPPNYIPFYFFGIIVGSFFWSYFISRAIRRFGSLFPRLTRYKYPYSYWVRGFHNFCLIGCITLTLTSLPYYGLDYLFTNPFGFVPQDRVFEGTAILKTDMKDAYKGRLGEKSSHASIDTDVSLFDRGRYSIGPISVEFPIESLNYQGEYAWRSRFDRLSSHGLTKGGGLLDQYLTTQLGPVEEALQKQRREKKREQQKQQIQKFIQNKEKNILESEIDIDPEMALPDPNDLMDSYEHLIERFVEDYTAEANFEDPEVPDLVDEKMIRFSAFLDIAKYGFDMFSMFETVDPVDEELAKEIKEKFSENFVNRFLVNFDISNFLKRQPKTHQLTSQDEISLFQKRLILAEYYDTLRSYAELPFSETFQPLFCGPKSYANRIYNQQFKGTLKIVERLFSIHLEDDENIPNIPNNEITTKQKEEEMYLKFKKDPSVLKFDQPLYQMNFLKKNPLIHEQLLEQMESSIQEADSNPFLQEGKPLPFFVGWDNQQRRFVVTNRLLTRQKTLSNISVQVLKDNFRKFSSVTAQPGLRRRSNLPGHPGLHRSTASPDITKSKSSKKDKTVLTFTTWPVTEKALHKNPLLSRLFRTRTEMTGTTDDLFKYTEPLMEEESIIYKKLPSIVQRIELKNKIQLSLAPTRGGFIWLGNEPLKYKFQFKLPFSEVFKNWSFSDNKKNN